MAEKKVKSNNTPTKDKAVEKKPVAKQQAAQRASAEVPATKSKSGMSRNQTYIVAALAVVVIFALFFIFIYPNSLIATVPFSTFKSNIQGSPRLSITATYSNQSQLANESICFTSMIQVVSHTRLPSTIDFFIIDKATNVCTYSTTGLGGSVNPITTNSSYCLGRAYGEDGIFINYSNANSTIITPGRMFVYGNDAYLAKCPIAIELS